MKKNVTKILALLMALAMVLSFAACSGGSDDKTTAADNTTADVTDGANPSGAAKGAASKEDAKYVVGVCQLVQHVALDAATQGFMDAINEALPGQVYFDSQNASGEPANCTTIVNGFVSGEYDLIMANATPALQAAAAATETIPVLATSITDYASALEIDGWTGTVGGNVSGTSDLAPLDQQAAMVKEWFPDASTVGIIYCTAEANSVYQAETIKGYLEAEGLTVNFYSFTDSNDVSSVTQKACDESDVIYIPTDNTAASNTEAIANIVLTEKVPVVAGEEGICKGCGVCTLSISYYDLGYETGKMAVQILTGAADISTMPVQFAAKVTKEYNAANVEALGLTVPSDEYVAIGE